MLLEYAGEAKLTFRSPGSTWFRNTVARAKQTVLSTGWAESRGRKQNRA